MLCNENIAKKFTTLKILFSKKNSALINTLIRKIPDGTCSLIRNAP